MIEDNNPLNNAQTKNGINYDCQTKQDKSYLRKEQPAGDHCFKAFKDCYGLACMFAYMPCGPCGCATMQTIGEGFEGLVTKNGKYHRKLGPGMYQYNIYTEKIIQVDMRAQILDVKAQTLLTKDNVNLVVDGYCQYRIVVPEQAMFKVENLGKFISFMIQGTLKTIFSENTMESALTERKRIEEETTKIIDSLTDPFGCKVIYIGIQKVVLPTSLQNAMASVAESENQKAARLIDAQSNFDAAKTFRMASDTLSQNPMSLQLQYFEVLKQIASENNELVILPDELLDYFRKK